HPISPSGGDTFAAKWGVFKHFGEYMAAMNQEWDNADVIHLRCPANISLLALLRLCISTQPKIRWVKYAGNWNPRGKQAFSYTLQRWILKKNLHRGVVTVNGEWSGQPNHVLSFYNPSLTAAEQQSAALAGARKLLASPYRLLFVGRLESAKGVGEILTIAARLQKCNSPFLLDLVGDGPEKAVFENRMLDLHLKDKVCFHGWQPRPALAEYYRRAHFILLPSSASEGWPKVLSEAMAYGVVPLASTVSSIPQILAKTGAGVALPASDVDGYVDTILRMIAHPAEWKSMSTAGIQAAKLFSYDYYLDSVNQVFSTFWNLPITAPKGLN
ncbi:MAG TPA: glycosyltransferase, partial [Anaerolinea sp.]|nr:glycosyltransferase [Anaerolinea sp.]